MDTLGAGDAFIARLLVGLASAEPLGRSSSATRPGLRHGELCVSYGAFGYRTPLHGHAAELDPIRNGRLDLR